ncbi:YceD family protein [Kordiimonas aquimaris]|uniref:YceD family protein n=1 Tax=Kordiimonas aquimaris TaxID=707591 RepID=UPI0021CF99BD|nr:DUF177 domain-containing protein [Kordiimonas aquimaris]
MTQTFDLSLSIPRSEINQDERRFKVEASEAELSGLAERFKIVSIAFLSADISVSTARDRDAIIVSGHVSAKLKQKCIVSLAPVDEIIDEDFELNLVEPEIANQFDEDEVYLDPDAPDYDALEGEQVALGEIVAQTLSVMMDPYPRAADAELQDVPNGSVSVNAELEKKPNPFAVLSKLNDES